jgi:hypothetical protein
MRAHFEEENARAALLLEQAAFSLLALRPPMVRGTALHCPLRCCVGRAVRGRWSGGR